MGSFNIKGFSSNLPIGNLDEVAIFPCIVEKAPFYNYCSVIDNDLYCHPISFPIYGKYSDYGEFCDYEKEANVEILEKHFGLSIEDIIQTFVRIGDDGYVDADKESEILKHLPIDTNKQSLTLCVEHKAIYDRIGDIFNPKVIDFNKISCFTLEELGFIRTSCKDLGIKYDRQYSEFETLYMFPNNALNNTYLLKDVDGFFSVLKRSDEDDKFYKEFRFKIPNKKYESIFISCVKDLLEFSEYYIGLKFDIPENSPIRTMRFYNFNFIKSAEIYNRKIKEREEFNKEVEGLIQKNGVLTQKHKNILRRSYDDNLIFMGYGVRSVVKLSYPSLLANGAKETLCLYNNDIIFSEPDKFSDMIGKFIGFNTHLTLSSGAFFPSLSYGQDMNWKREMLINDLYRNVIEKKMSDQFKDSDDDDDGELFW